MIAVALECWWNFIANCYVDFHSSRVQMRLENYQTRYNSKSITQLQYANEITQFVDLLCRFIPHWTTYAFLFLISSSLLLCLRSPRRQRRRLGSLPFRTSPSTKLLPISQIANLRNSSGRISNSLLLSSPFNNSSSSSFLLIPVPILLARCLSLSYRTRTNNLRNNLSSS